MSLLKLIERATNEKLRPETGKWEGTSMLLLKIVDSQGEYMRRVRRPEIYRENSPHEAKRDKYLIEKNYRWGIAQGRK